MTSLLNNPHNIEDDISGTVPRLMKCGQKKRPARVREHPRRQQESRGTAMVARIPMPRLIEHNETGATIVFGWHSGDVIRYDIHCECGTTRFDLIAREPVNPEHYLWAAAEYHHELWSDCECLKGSEEFKAHLN